MSDDHLKGIAATGGVVCVNFCAGFLDDTRHTVDRLVDHLMYIADLAGIDHVGLGPDFVDEVLRELFPSRNELFVGGIDAFACVPGLQGASGLPLDTEPLSNRGQLDDDIQRIVAERTFFVSLTPNWDKSQRCLFENSMSLWARRTSGTATWGALPNDARRQRWFTDTYSEVCR